jgi:hypothetical protein
VSFLSKREQGSMKRNHACMYTVRAVFVAVVIM